MLMTERFLWKGQDRDRAAKFRSGVRRWKIYVLMLDDQPRRARPEAKAGSTGAFYIIKPGEKAGKSSATPPGWPLLRDADDLQRKIYIKRPGTLYAFGKQGNNPGLATETATAASASPGQATQLQIIPSEVLLARTKSPVPHSILIQWLYCGRGKMSAA